MRLLHPFLNTISVILLVVACSNEEGPTGVVRTLGPAFLPPGSCGSHMFNVDGGAEFGGVTIYHSNCTDDYLAWYKIGGNYYSYPGVFSFGEAAGEDFCQHFPTVYSCSHAPQQFEWCEVDATDCEGVHLAHEHRYE